MPDERPDAFSHSFADIFAGVELGDQEAARKLYERFIDQLIRLASRKLKYQLGSGADPESVAHSAFESFFDGVQHKRFELRNWGMVFGLLAHIVFRKCLRRKREEMQSRHIPDGKITTIEEWQAVDATPGPDDEAMVADMLETALRGFEAEQRTVIEHYMKGMTVDSVAQQAMLSERTVHRIVGRFRDRLLELMESE